MGKAINWLRNLILGQQKKSKSIKGMLTSSERIEKRVQHLRNKTGNHFVRRLVNDPSMFQDEEE